MRVRDATAADVAPVTALEEAVFGVDAWSAVSVAEELTGERRNALVAELDGEVVGYVVALTSGDVVDLQRVAVDPAHRRTGLASRLVSAAQAGAREQGADRMLLEVSARNAGALAFYAVHGFVEIDRRPRYYRDGTDAIVLRAALGNARCGGRRA